MNCEKSETILPEKLKSIEVDAEIGKFSINGKEVGGGCAGVSFSCEPGSEDGRYNVRVQVGSSVHLAGYDDAGKRIWEGRYRIRNRV